MISLCKLYITESNARDRDEYRICFCRQQKDTKMTDFKPNTFRQLKQQFKANNTKT